jgi:hypothetical protein
MEWTPETIALAALAVAIAGHAIANFFRSPNQQFEDINKRLTEHTVRMNNIENGNTQFAIQYAGSFARHDESIEHLTDAIKLLTVEVKTLQGIVGNARSKSPTRQR